MTHTLQSFATSCRPDPGSPRPLAVTRRNLVHAVVYLVMSFFGSALLFYLLGAPLLAALEVIITLGHPCTSFYHHR
ncbi:MAG: NADH-quinone oxidoreductase subunit J [Desulfobacterales bacterium]|nr:NADH-quinone oxidoreductase subunit J [Desulfobacterales bacterium]